MKRNEKTSTNLPAGPEIINDDVVFRVEDIEDHENVEEVRMKKNDKEITSTTTTTTTTEEEPGRLSHNIVSNRNNAGTNNISNTLSTQDPNNINTGQITTANTNAVETVTGSDVNMSTERVTMVEAYVVSSDEDNNKCLPNTIFRSKEGNIKKKCWILAASILGLACGIITGIAVSTKQSSSSDTSYSNTPPKFSSMNPTRFPSLRPSRFPSLQPSVFEIIVGARHTCALTLIKEIYCWGYNFYGQLGDGSTDDQNTPTKINFENGRKVFKAYLGGSHSCAVFDYGELQCWGWNFYGQVGDNSTIDKIKPTKINIKNESSITQMALGFWHTCAVFDDGTMYCWGLNSDGQLGDETKIDKTVPTASIAVKNKVVQVSTGGFHTCVIIQDNSLQCWGYNSFGQLGDGTTVDKTMPTEVSIDDGKAVMQVVTGCYHTCALSVDGILYCWGYNYYGQLGDGTTTNKPVPKKVIVNNGKKIKQVASIDEYVCAISDDDTVWCWGSNGYGQIGDGTTWNKLVPTKIDIGDERAVTQIVVGVFHTCVRLDDNAMKCWGWNGYGQLGTGNNNIVIKKASNAQIITFPSTG